MLLIVRSGITQKMDGQKNDDQDVGANITLNNEGNKISMPCGQESNERKDTEHGKENSNQQSADHNYIDKSMKNTNALPTAISGRPNDEGTDRQKSSVDKQFAYYELKITGT